MYQQFAQKRCFWFHKHMSNISSAPAVSFRTGGHQGGKPSEMESEANHHALCQRAYAMKKHRATRLHYDLRLEWNGVLLSWALPEGPSCRAEVPREAIQMEDHRVVNMLFEGVHETAPIMLWDRGTWEPHSEFKDIASCLRKGILRFTLYGERLKGSWMLARTNRNVPRPVWWSRGVTRWFRRSLAVGRPFRLSVPHELCRASVFTPRSSNRTCAINASGSRRKSHAFAHGKLFVRFVRRTKPSTSCKVVSEYSFVAFHEILCLAHSHRRSLTHA